jgi:uncharacterized membrane protein YkoI
MAAMKRPRCPIATILALGLALIATTAGADSDQDRARAAVESGQVLPLKTLLERLERDHPGHLLEVELEEEDGQLRYEVKLLQPDGRLVKLIVDAATGEVIGQRPGTGDRARGH